MNGHNQFGNEQDGKNKLELLKTAGESAKPDAKLEQALRDFRLSVRAWSEAAYSRPRTNEMSVRRRSWRLAAGWALGCALLAGGIAGGVMEHHRQQEAAQTAAAAQQQAREQQVAAAKVQVRQQDGYLLAKVDSDTAQEVPDAMEPLAQLMENGGTE